jgi:hypothetical protein
VVYSRRQADVGQEPIQYLAQGRVSPAADLVQTPPSPPKGGCREARSRPRSRASPVIRVDRSLRRANARERPQAELLRFPSPPCLGRRSFRDLARSSSTAASASANTDGGLPGEALVAAASSAPGAPRPSASRPGGPAGQRAPSPGKARRADSESECHSSRARSSGFGCQHWLAGWRSRRWSSASTSP